MYKVPCTCKVPGSSGHGRVIHTLEPRCFLVAQFPTAATELPIQTGILTLSSMPSWVMVIVGYPDWLLACVGSVKKAALGLEMDPFFFFLLRILLGKQPPLLVPAGYNLGVLKPL